MRPLRPIRPILATATAVLAAALLTAAPAQAYTSQSATPFPAGWSDCAPHATSFDVQRLTVHSTDSRPDRGLSLYRTTLRQELTVYNGTAVRQPSVVFLDPATGQRLAPPATLPPLEAHSLTSLWAQLALPEAPVGTRVPLKVVIADGHGRVLYCSTGTVTTERPA